MIAFSSAGDRLMNRENEQQLLPSWPEQNTRPTTDHEPSRKLHKKDGIGTQRCGYEMLSAQRNDSFF